MPAKRGPMKDDRQGVEQLKALWRDPNIDILPGLKAGDPYGAQVR